MIPNSFIQTLYIKNKICNNQLADKEAAIEFIDNLFNALFACYEGKYATQHDVEKAFEELTNSLKKIISSLIKNENKALQLTESFFATIPNIYQTCLGDAATIVAFDPAATSIEEVMISYPGFYATAVYRLANQLHIQAVPILPRLLSEHAHSKTGIDIHPGASIGKNFFIDHGTGIVIGETAVVGNYVKIYQGVTLGALNVSKDAASTKRHPTIQDNVVIYAGATILGGNTIIGNDSIIGGNVWLTHSVNPHSVVYHKSDVKVRDNNPFPEPVNFVI